MKVLPGNVALRLDREKKKALSQSNYPALVVETNRGEQISERHFSRVDHGGAKTKITNNWKMKQPKPFKIQTTFF